MLDMRLYSLLKIMETGSFTKAAEQLSLSQPAVSQHIRQLEESLQVKIFEHSRNRFRLTTEGEIVVKYARQLVSMTNRLARALKNAREHPLSLTVGITHTAESSAIIEAIAACTAAYEGLTLKLLTGTADTLHAMLRGSELDFAVVEGELSDPALGSMMLDTDCLVLAVPPDHALARQTMVSISQFRQEKLILRLPNSNTRNLFVSALESRSLSISDFNVILEIDSVASIKELVRRGFGVSVLARNTCLDEQRKRELALLTIKDLSMMRETNLVYLKSFAHPEILHGIVRQYGELRRR